MDCESGWSSILPSFLQVLLECQQEKVTLLIVSSKDLNSRRGRVQLPADRKIGADWLLTGQVFQVTDLDPAGFITRENDSDMRDAML